MTHHQAKKDKIVLAFNSLNSTSMHILKDFYALDVLFIDPLGEIHGREGVTAYYAGLYRTVTSIHFEFHDILEDGEKFAAVWTMHLIAKGLNQGREVCLDGTSILLFNQDDQVVYHRDYFDMGAFIYENVPVLSAVIRLIKRRLQHHQ